MRTVVWIFILGIVLVPSFTFAQHSHSEVVDLPAPTQEIEYDRGRIVQILDESELAANGDTAFVQVVEVEVTTGERSGDKAVITYTESFIEETPRVSPGEKVVLAGFETEEGREYQIVDRYRTPAVVWFIVAFVAMAIAFGGWKGLTSILGLVFSVAVLVWFTVPQIVSGASPLLISLLSAALLAVVTLYVAHGFTRRTSIALGATMITLTIATLLSLLAVRVADLLGRGSHEALILQLGPNGDINLQGLLLGGIIIATLGVLDDITTAQAATVDEIHKANKKLSFKEVYKRANSVGREHIASLINTLVLVYAGASLPLLIVFSAGFSQPSWMLANSEFFAEEVVRTMIGSMSLVLAVPITTALASYFLVRKKS